MTRRRGIRAAVIPIAIVALAGCGNSGHPGATSATSTARATWSRPSDPPDPQTLLAAGAAAVATVPSSTLVSIGVEQSGSWKVRVVPPDGTEQQLEVGADGITVLVGPTPVNASDADKAKLRARVQAAHLDYREATNKVLAAVPSGSITELDLDDNNGGTAWAAEVWDNYLVEHKVTIDAASGELLQNKQV